MNNFEDSIGGIVGAGLAGGNNAPLKNSAKNPKPGQKVPPGPNKNVPGNQNPNQNTQSKQVLARQNKWHAQNKSPDIVASHGRHQMLIQKDEPKEALLMNDKQSQGAREARERAGVQIANQYSATKSQANITNNNFAKFSSSGYTNNAFLLMSGHHDFASNDFQLQSGGNWNMDANQIEKNLKSTSKSRGFSQTKNQNFVVQQNQAQELNVPNLTNQKNEEIEESIIEEDIQSQRGHQSPASPLINSRTKPKGKLNLFKLNPPKPFNAAEASGVSPANNGKLQENNGPPFIFSRQDTNPYQLYPGALATTKFDTHSSQNQDQMNQAEHTGG